MRKKKSLWDVGTYCILVILVLVMIYSGLRIVESTVFPSDQSTEAAVPRKTIYRDGVAYFPRQDVTVMMVLGIDQSGPAVNSNYHRNEGAADSVLLLIFDETNEECSVLYLNRDTMVNMDTIGVMHTYSGQVFGQLALAHTYGSGLEDSCENMKKTLMGYLHGLTIDYYVSMRMDAIPILNDAVGGVTVNVVDDFSAVDPSITMGQITLRGDQVMNFIRTRKDVGDQKNITRMERQKEYVGSFLKALRSREQEDTEFLLKVYEEVSPYLVTDCSSTVMSSMLERYLEYPIRQIVTPEGTNVVNKGYYEFYPDEEKLDQLILSLFYAPK